MLKWRVITALILLPLVLGVVFFLPTAGFALAMAVVVALGAWEWTHLIGIQAQRERLAHVGALLVLVAGSAAALGSATAASVVLAIGVVGWLGLIGWLVAYQRGRAADTPVTGRPGTVLGLLLFVPAWFGLVFVHGQPGGAWLVFSLLVLTWAADVGAYFAGRALGRRRLAPRISPGKTMEGAAGGLALTLVAAWLLASVLPAPLPGGLSLVFLAVAMFVASVAGDLFESMIKRRCGVKDSGTLLPGHGGVLDRIDSLTATAPVFAAGLSWL
ncbi:phosphatidate cytidylyltransferase [Aquisalimonas asiatica]|uniref:Phosphatidate cytidylyltransferase n=1 Tax=Aquisalimonas asiatica TaxID=406100 RepID=A0A1H8QJW8_9GAMM|nr:phosphatidate cytidylyltransferase [Aquisalimonas asiatica]SEO54482.1 phosphatidate cytidylyltransferase [Aquisalimonas asiatica]